MKVVVTPEGEPIALKDDGTWISARGTSSVLERWKALELEPEVVGMFAGLFDRVEVHVIDTDECVLCIHQGDRIEFEAGGADPQSGIAVEIYAYQAERLAKEVAMGTLDSVERFRIARTLMGARQTGPKSLLQNPLMSTTQLRKLISGKNLIHVYLTSPNPDIEMDARFSWIHVDGEWVVVPGFYGRPRRVFRVSVDDALDLQRKLFKAMSGGGVTDWMKMAHWYLGWRKKVEVPAGS